MMRIRGAPDVVTAFEKEASAAEPGGGSGGLISNRAFVGLTDVGPRAMSWCTARLGHQTTEAHFIPAEERPRFADEVDSSASDA